MKKIYGYKNIGYLNIFENICGPKFEKLRNTSERQLKEKKLYYYKMNEESCKLPQLYTFNFKWR